MALIVEELKSTSVQIGGEIDQTTGKKSSVVSITQNFRVTATGYTTPEDITDIQVACTSGVPLVNVSTWYSSAANVTVPQAVCNSVSVSRNATNRFCFDVECNFQTPAIAGTGCAIAPPANVTDITPSEQSSIGAYDRRLYMDKDGNQCMKLPTESLYASPVTERIPTFSLKIMQYEPSLTYEQQIERSYKTNSATYRGKAAGLWMIGAVSASEETIQLAGGPTTCAKVTYPITLSERFYWPPGVAATEANKVIYGHDHAQPLVDTFYKTLAPVEAIVPNLDRNGTSVITGYINNDGTKRDPSGANDERPDYIRHRTQDQINFSDFLQV